MLQEVCASRSANLVHFAGYFVEKFVKAPLIAIPARSLSPAPVIAARLPSALEFRLEAHRKPF